MYTTLVMLVLVGAPKAPANSDFVVHVPRLDALSTVAPFFQAAGARSPMLRMESWRSTAVPLLGVDVTSPDSLSAAGIDAEGPFTVSYVDERTVSCVVLKDPTRYSKRVSEALGSLGKVSTRQEAGVPVTLASDQLDRVLAAVVTVGRDSCSVVGNGLSVEKQIPAVVRALLKPGGVAASALAEKLPGVATAIIPGNDRSGAISVTAKGHQLTLDARARGLALAPLMGAGASPYATFAPRGMLVFRGRFARGAMASLATQTARSLPAGVTLSPLAAELDGLLTGNVAVAVSGVKVTAGLRSLASRFFAAHLAVLAETSDPEAARRLIAKIDPKTLTVREGRMDLAVEGSTIILSNDEEVKTRALATLATSKGRQAHAIELVATPAEVARGLSQIPLLDVVQTPELASLLVVSTELGPLLLSSESVTGWLDPAGPGLHRGQLTWVLDEKRLGSEVPPKP